MCSLDSDPGKEAQESQHLTFAIEAIDDAGLLQLHESKRLDGNALRLRSVELQTLSRFDRRWKPTLTRSLRHQAERAIDLLPKDSDGTDTEGVNQDGVDQPRRDRSILGVAPGETSTADAHGDVTDSQIERPRRDRSTLGGRSSQEENEESPVEESMLVIERPRRDCSVGARDPVEQKPRLYSEI